MCEIILYEMTSLQHGVVDHIYCNLYIELLLFKYLSLRVVVGWM